MVDPVRAGIIGLSWIAADPAAPASDPVLGTAPPYSHASAMAAEGGIEVVAVCDLRDDVRDAFLSQWQPVWPHVRAYAEVDRMLTEEQLDLASVVTPDHLHASMVVRAVGAGIPMIFCEKPLATSIDDADEMLRRIAAAGTTVIVNHTWRWRPEVMEAHAIIASGQLGPLSQIVIEAGGPRAMLFRNLSHFLDLAVYLADDDPSWVIAELEAGSEDYGLTYTGGGGADPSLDPGANVYVAFEGGSRAFVTGLKSSVQDVSVHVLCEHGRVVIDTLGARIVSVARTGDGAPGSLSGPAVAPVSPRASLSGMQAGLRDLILAHRSGREPSSSAASARRTIALIDAVLRSQAGDNQRVAVRRPAPG
jgi:predicted dehydrogenase